MGGAELVILLVTCAGIVLVIDSSYAYIPLTYFVCMFVLTMASSSNGF